jgi:hypothetical protein
MTQVTNVIRPPRISNDNVRNTSSPADAVAPALNQPVVASPPPGWAERLVNHLLPNPAMAESSFRLNEVYCWLTSLHPPLPHLLPRFQELGFHNAELLCAAASWPADELSSFLKTYGPAGEKMFTAVEIAILKIKWKSLGGPQSGM